MKRDFAGALGSAWTETERSEEVDYFSAVAAASARRAHALGNGPDGTIVALRWTGGPEWRPTPFPTAASTVMNALDAPAADDVWAVGSSLPPGATGFRPRAAHWDGTAWAFDDPVLADGLSSGDLHAVSVAESGEVWAVGHAESGGPAEPYVLRKAGGTWEPVG